MSNKGSLMVGLGTLTVLLTTPILGTGCKTTSEAKSQSTEMKQGEKSNEQLGHCGSDNHCGSCGKGDKEGSCGAGSCGSEHDGSCGTEK